MPVSASSMFEESESSSMARILSLTCLLVVLLTLGARSTTAQVTGTPARSQPSPTPGGRSAATTQPAIAKPATGEVPTAKIAVIYSADFQDPKTGIARYIATMNKLEAEFQPIQNELNASAKRLNDQQAEIANLQRVGGTNPAQVQAKIDQLDQQKKEYQRKGEDAQAAYQKRRTQVLGPLQDEIGRALDAYAQARGITLIMDGSRVPIAYAAASIDITKAFIGDYNSKNPVTASTTTPK
jgi:Skp family chaperone for outer membrane proteins